MMSPALAPSVQRRVMVVTRARSSPLQHTARAASVVVMMLLNVSFLTGGCG